ncbi:MAG: hypothetical protein HUU10_05090 [Bacteroidetes bacterium]|nr:hypothetical protein [Bacteroidota bacterium]
MASITFRHLGSLLVVSIVFFFIGMALQPLRTVNTSKPDPTIARWLSVPGIDWQDPLHQAIVADLIEAANPDSDGEMVVRSIRRYQSDQLARGLAENRQQAGLVFHDPFNALRQFSEFTLLYAIVLIFSVFGAQTIGTYRFLLFIRKEEQESEGWHDAGRTLLLFVLFSPGFLVAYSLKAFWTADSWPVLVALGLLTNGSLALYSQKFLNLLLTNHHHGFIQMARVRGVNENFSPGKPDGVPWRVILSWKKSCPGHLLHHSMLNARLDYGPTAREQAAFTVTCLIILEMALNIQGRFGYELLRQVLFRNLPDVLIMMASLFLLVRATEWVVDVQRYRKQLSMDRSASGDNP